MSTAKFEKLIDLIINEDQERAEQLFHEIVVEKSREIYESMMDDDLEENQAMELMQEIEVEESGDITTEDEIEDEEISGDFDVEGEDDMDDMEDMDGEMSDMDDMDDEMSDMDDEEVDMGSEEAATKDDIMDLEDKLDQILAAFEAEFGEEEEEEGEEEESGVMESVEMKKVPQPKGEDHKAKSPVAANAGAAGMASKPVKFSGSSEGAPTSPKAPSSNAYHTKSGQSVKGAGSFQNAPGGAKGVKSGSGVPAAKPTLKQASGVNTKDIVPESRVSKKKRI